MVTLSTGSAPGERGRRTTVAVQMHIGGSGLGAWMLDVSYDAAALDVIDCEGEAGSICNQRFAPGVIRIVGAAAAGLTGDHELARITLEGSAGGAGTGTIAIGDAALADPQGRDLSDP